MKDCLLGSNKGSLVRLFPLSASEMNHVYISSTSNDASESIYMPLIPTSLFKSISHSHTHIYIYRVENHQTK